mgnify:CR=1 FL=1
MLFLKLIHKIKNIIFKLKIIVLLNLKKYKYLIFKL